MADKEAAKLIHGIALHNYFYFGVTPTILDVVHDKYPNLFVINTEFCIVPSETTGKYSYYRCTITRITATILRI